MSSSELVTQVREMVHKHDCAALRALFAARSEGLVAAAVALVINDEPPATAATLLARLHTEDAAHVIRHLAAEAVAEILPEVPDERRQATLRLLTPAELCPIIAAMPPDEATDALQDMGEHEAQQVISALPPALRASVQKLVEYDETSAGGRMTTEAATISADITAAAAIEQLRREAHDVENFNTIYAVDEDGRLVGTLSLRDLVMAAPDAPVADLAARHMHWAKMHLDQEELAQYMIAHDLDGMAVIDDEGALLGQVTLDDAAEVIVEEATEDIQRIVGVRGDESVFSPFWASIRRRLPWLILNVPMAGLASTMVHIFTGAIERVASVVAFLPLVGGIAGNAGGQTVSVFVRGLALGEATSADVWRCVARQAAIGASMGLVLGVLVGGLESLWTRALILSVIGGIAVMMNCMTACAFGALLPFVLRRLGFDPAMGANLVDTAFTDASGYFYVLSFTTLALWLHWL